MTQITNASLKYFPGKFELMTFFLLCNCHHNKQGSQKSLHIPNAILKFETTLFRKLPLV